MLAGLLAAATALTIVLAYAYDPVQAQVVSVSGSARTAPLIAAALLFGPVSVLLAMVSPFAIRLSASSLSTVGTTAGTVYGISTAGSIAGTLLAAFWLILVLDIERVVLLIAVALALCSLLSGMLERRKRHMLLGAALAIAACVLLLRQDDATFARLAPGTATWSPRFRPAASDAPVRPVSGSTLRERASSRYHHLSVLDLPSGRGGTPARALRVDNAFQTIMSRSGERVDPAAPPLVDYIAAFDLMHAYRPRVRRVLFVGLGGGSAPTHLAHVMPDVAISAVEIDPQVVRLARRWFALPDDMPVAVADGRSWLAASDDRFDAIVLDAYVADSIPFHLVTREFLDVVRARLAPDGLLLANVAGALEGDDSGLVRSTYRTWSEAFDHVVLHPTAARQTDGAFDPRATGHPRAREIQNVVLVASDKDLSAYAALVEQAQQLQVPLNNPALGALAQNRYDARLEVDDVPTLTDDYAPVDALLYTDLG